MLHLHKLKKIENQLVNLAHFLIFLTQVQGEVPYSTIME